MNRKVSALSCFTAVAACVALSGAAVAAPITFTTKINSPDFPMVTGPDSTGQTSLTSVANDGLTMTITAAGGFATPRITGSNDGGGGFGVNGNGSWDINNRDAGFEESLTLTFNQDVYLSRITFKQFAFADAVQLDVASLSIRASGNSAITPATPGVSTPGNATGPFTVNFTGNDFQLNVGQTLVIRQGVGSNNGFLLESVTVTPIPEPGSMTLAVLGGLLILARRRTAAE